jgi:uncharacterized repeat protein (TIGR01451 family)
VLSDTLPVSVTLLSSSQPTDTQSGFTLGWDLGDLPDGASQTFTVVVQVHSDVSGTISNNVLVSSSTPDPIPANNSYTKLTTVGALADLSVSKSDYPTTVIAGETLTYTIAVTNSGPSYARSVILSDTLPAGASLISSSRPTDTQSGNTLGWDLGDLADGASQTITVVVQVHSDVTGPFSNTVWVTSTTADPVPGDNSWTEFTDISTQADLSIDKQDTPDIVVAGELLTYTIEITNNGPSDAATVLVSDTLPLSVTLIAVEPTTSTQSGHTLGWDLGDLPDGASQTFTVVVQVHSDVIDPVSNTAWVSSTTPDPVPGDNSWTEFTSVTTEADLAIDKWDTPATVAAGGLLTYTIAVTNNGPSDAIAVIISDTLPLSTTLVAVDPPTSTQTGRTLGWFIDRLVADTAESISVVLIVGSDVISSSISNSAQVSSSTLDQNPGNESVLESTGIIQEADLGISKSGWPTPVLANSVLSYTIVYSNAGPSDAQGVYITDTLPVSATYQGVASMTPALVEVLQTAQLISWYTPTLPAGAAGTIVITLTVEAEHGETITNQVEIAGETPDPYPGNNGYEETTPVTLGLISSKSSRDVTGPPLYPGDQIEYLVVVTNTHPTNTYNDVTIADPLPASTALLGSPSCPAWATCYEAGGTVIATASSLGPGQVLSLVFEVLVDSDTAGDTITNQAQVTASAFSDLPQPPPTADPVTTLWPSLALRKWADPEVSPSPDDWTKYSYVVTNTGNVLLTGVQVWDDRISPKIGPYIVPDLSAGQVYTIEQWWPMAWDTPNVATATATTAGFPGFVYATAAAYYDVIQGLSLTLQVSAFPEYIPAAQVVTYTYQLTNIGDDWLEDGVITDTVYGPIASGITLAPGESHATTLLQTVSDTTENWAYARGVDRLENPIVVSDSAVVRLDWRFLYLPLVFKNH